MLLLMWLPKLLVIVLSVQIVMPVGESKLLHQVAALVTGASGGCRTTHLLQW